MIRTKAPHAGHFMTNLDPSTRATWVMIGFRHWSFGQWMAEAELGIGFIGHLAYVDPAAMAAGRVHQLDVGERSLLAVGAKDEEAPRDPPARRRPWRPHRRAYAGFCGRRWGLGPFGGSDRLLELARQRIEQHLAFPQFSFGVGHAFDKNWPFPPLLIFFHP